MKGIHRLAAIFGPFVAAAMIMLSPVAASAVVNLTYNDTLKDIQQTDNTPCVIGSPSCSQTLPFTSVAGGPGDRDLVSPTYTVAQLEAEVGSVFNILIDINQACGDATVCPITLELVEVIIDGVVEFLFTGPQFVPLAGSLQGNGFSDAGLETVDLSSFADSDTVVFHIVWSGQTDGQESFFLAPTDAPPFVAEPGTMLLLGSGLVGMAAWGRKKFRR